MKTICMLVCAFFALSAQSNGQRRTAVQNQPAVVAGDTAKPKVRGELIRPIKVWKQGQSIDADAIDCNIVYDDLEGSAKVYFQLKDSTGAEVASGNLDISGADYRQFNTAQNRINWVYNFTIRTLRLQNRNQLVN